VERFTRALSLVIASIGFMTLVGSASAHAATPTPDTRFWLPVQVQNTVVMTQGNGQYDHSKFATSDGHGGTIYRIRSYYALDFAVGTGSFVVTASQGGAILDYRDDSDIHCDDYDHQKDDPPDVKYSTKTSTGQQCWTTANYVLIANDDGKTAALYLHLQQGSVSPYIAKYPQRHVYAGAPLGMAGTTGWAKGNPHLHFQVEDIPSAEQRTSRPHDWWWTDSGPVAFSDPEVLRYQATHSDWMTRGCWDYACPTFTQIVGPPTPTPTPIPIPTTSPTAGPNSCTTTTTGLIGVCLAAVFFTRRRRGYRSTYTNRDPAMADGSPGQSLDTPGGT
jgi:Peptidase family M23